MQFVNNLYQSEKTMKVMKSIGLMMILAVLGTIPAYGEIFQIEPIKDHYEFGQAVTINGSSDQDLVFVKIFDESGNMVDVLQLIASGQFLGVSMVTPSTWHQGTYTININDGITNATNTFQVTNQTYPKVLNYFDEFGGQDDQPIEQMIIVPIQENSTSILNTTSIENVTSISNVTSIDNATSTNSTYNELIQENIELKAKVASLESQIANLKQLILEQVKVIYDWVISQ